MESSHQLPDVNGFVVLFSLPGGGPISSTSHRAPLSCALRRGSTRGHRTRRETCADEAGNQDGKPDGSEDIGKMVGIEKDAGRGDADGYDGCRHGNGNAPAAGKQKPQRNDAGNGDGSVGRGEGGVLEAAGNPRAVILEAVPAGRHPCRRAGASSEDAEDIGREATGNSGPEHKQNDADADGAFEEPGDEQQQQEKNDDGNEVAPVGKEPGNMFDQRVGMRRDPCDDTIVKDKRERAEDKAGGKKQEAKGSVHD